MGWGLIIAPASACLSFDHALLPHFKKKIMKIENLN
jgi:hypothetical protein